MAVGEVNELLTIADAARLLKVSTVTIHRWLKQGRLTAYRIGPRAVRISRSELTRLLVPREGPGRGSAGTALVTPADLGIAPPTEEQIARRIQAISQAKALRQEMLQRRGGRPLPSSWQLIREAREERGA